MRPVSLAVSGFIQSNRESEPEAASPWCHKFNAASPQEKATSYCNWLGRELKKSHFHIDIPGGG